MHLPRHPATPLPRWARAADGLALGLFLLAAVVEWGGGFRERVFDVRISLTSGWRLAALAFAVAIARHAVRPSPPVWARVRAAVERAWTSRAVRVAVTAALTTRLAVLLAGYLATFTITPSPETMRLSEQTDQLEGLSAKWDARWYRNIVTYGYRWDGNFRRQQNVVFFPAMPVLMYVVGLPLGRRWLVAGTLVASIAFGWALWYLFRLAREQIDAIDDDAATSAVWLLATYPFAVYFSAAYTEGVYLLACAGAIYHTGRREPASAAMWGLIAGLSRPNGILLTVPLTILVAGPSLQAWRRRRLNGESDPRPFRIAEVAVVLAPVAGLALYSAYLWWQFGDPLAWQRGQFAWGRQYLGVWTGLTALFFERWDIISSVGFMGYTSAHPMDAMNTAAAMFALAALLPLTRRVGLAYGAFVAVNLLPPLIMGGMLSIGRMTSVMFPVFLWLATVVPASRLPAWTAAFAVFQGLIAALFFTWRPAF